MTRPETETVRRLLRLRHLAVAMASGVALSAAAEGTGGAPPLRLQQITFTASHESAVELRVQADAAVIDQAANQAQLEQVDAEWMDDAGRPSLRVRCEQGELDLRTNALLGRGDVRGQLGDGRRFTGPWLRYDPARGVAFTQAPVEIFEAGGRVLRGGGLEYHVSNRRLRLTAGARVEEQGKQ